MSQQAINTYPVTAILNEEADARPDLLGNLNPAQRQAVENLEGPLLVLAGAGTGKTRVLTARIAHILLSRKALPSQILAVTFTNKAAQEMLNRIEHMMGGQMQGLWLGTFHALCVRILRRHAELVDRHPDFTILDTDDQLRLIKQILKAENIDEKKLPPRVLLYEISRWKDRGLTPERVNVNAVDEDGTSSVHLYRLYQQRLKILNAVDFGDIIMLNLELFQKHADVLAIYQKQFRYILVDEYQDTNVAQYLWLRLLAMGSNNLCCVGDDDQSIYGWRGAEVTNILRFEKDFAGATVIRLEENYRSTPHILGAASGLITHNEGRLGKTLWTQCNQGDKVKVKCLWDGDEEARYVGEEIETLQRQGFSLSSMAILVRAAYQTREFEDRLITLGIPYRVIGGPRFYERQEIRDAIAYLRVIAQQSDSLAFERIINVPRRGIGQAAMQTLHQYARIENISLFEAARVLVQTDELKGQVRKSIQDLLHDFARWQQRASVITPAELARIVLDESGYTTMWQQDKSPDAPGRLENLKEFVNALKEFDTLTGFLEHISLVMENTTAAAGVFDLVNIMTLHSAKGLEFDIVFLAGWEEGIFPNTRSIEEGHLEEERRLAYVGLTRTKQKAYITYVMNRRLYGTWQPAIISRFIDELPRDHIQFEDQPRGFHFSRPASSQRYLKEDIQTPKMIPVNSAGTFQTGDRVFHLKFGYGVIAHVNGDKLEINFDHSGHKHVVASFVKPASAV
jgi:DNA helicase-2/ATP-dependent DNA helicase PcrA